MCLRRGILLKQPKKDRYFKLLLKQNRTIFCKCVNFQGNLIFFLGGKINKIKLQRFTNNAILAKIGFLHEIVCLFIY